MFNFDWEMLFVVGEWEEYQPVPELRRSIRWLGCPLHKSLLVGDMVMIVQPPTLKATLRRASAVVWLAHLDFGTKSYLGSVDGLSLHLYLISIVFASSINLPG